MKRSRNISVFLILLFLSIGGMGGGCSKATPRPALQVGDKMIDFSLSDASGRFMKLSDVQPGTYLVLIFYRGAWCTACANRLLDYKKDFEKFPAVHAALAAVSVDPVSDSAVFNGQWRFPFPLLSDTEFHLIDAFGIRHVKGGHNGEDISRTGVVVIDPQKVIRYKYIGKDASDWPLIDEVVFNIQKMQTAGNEKPGGAS